jgi:sugar phosphate isomerase/epimerase
VPITVSFMAANYWARDVGWQPTPFDEILRATAERYSPIATYAEALDDVIADIASYDVEAVDLWTGHLDPAWATDEHVAIALETLDRHRLRIASYAGGLGETLDEFARTCAVAEALGGPLLGGSTAAWEADRLGVLHLLEQHGLRLALENHPDEHTPEDMLAKIGDAPRELVGTALDTGWWATQGYDAAIAIELLADRVMHVHLKDIESAGEHITCAFGDGVVPLESCVRVLQSIGYEGGLSVENGNDDVDPGDQIRASIALLRGWLAGETA